MKETRLSRDVDAPPEVVWRLVTDLDRAAEIVSAIESVERLDGGDGFGPGTRWRETRTMFGREATEEMEVTSLDEGRSYTVEAESRGTRYRSTLAVAPLAEGRSRLTMTFGARPRGLVGKLLAATVGRLAEGATRKALGRDLDDIAAAAERARPG